MKVSTAVIAAVMMGMGAGAQAAPEPGFFHESVSQSITINAEPAKVWALLGNFDGMALWDSTVDRSVSVDENQDELSRLVVYKEDVGREVDVLDERSDADMTMRYHVKSSPWPVAHYNAKLRVSRGPTPGTSVVEWRGSFDVKGLIADSDSRVGPESHAGPIVFGLDIETERDWIPSVDSRKVVRDKLTVKIITDLYRAGLDSLKFVLER